MNQERAILTTVKTIADRLREAREDLKLTQPELAKRARVSPGTIGNVEAGIRKEPRELLAIAAALNVDPQWLKTGRGHKRPQTTQFQASDHIKKYETSADSWPFSSELLAAARSADATARWHAENAARAVLKIDPLPRMTNLAAG